MSEKEYLDPKSPETMRIYALSRNRKEGRIPLKWLKMQPEDEPNQIAGMDPETNVLVGPVVYCGRRYKIIYKEPMILPFNTLETGLGVLHIAEIEGTLHATGLILQDVKFIACVPDDYSVRDNFSAATSEFWLAKGDEIKEIKD